MEEGLLPRCFFYPFSSVEKRQEGEGAGEEVINAPFVKCVIITIPELLLSNHIGILSPFDFGLTLLIIIFDLFSLPDLSANASPLTFPPGSFFWCLPSPRLFSATESCVRSSKPPLLGSTLSLIHFLKLLILSLSFLFLLIFSPKTRFATLIKTRPSASKKRYKNRSLTPLALLHNTQPRLPLSSLSLFPLQHLSTRATQQHFHTPFLFSHNCLFFLPPSLHHSSATQQQTISRKNVLSLRSPPPKTSLSHSTSKNSDSKSFHPARIRTRCTVVSWSTWSCPVGVSSPF